MSSINVLLSIALVFAAIASTGYATKYIPCPGKTLTAKIDKVTVSDCQTTPCTLKKGTNITVAVSFTMGPNSEAINATTSVHGIIDEVLVPYNTDYTDACATAGLKCPLKPNSLNNYLAKLYVSKLYPSISLYVRWELLDEKNRDIFCFQIPVTITG